MARVRVRVPSKSFWARAGWLSIALLFIVTAFGIGLYSFWQSTHQKDDTSAQQAQASKLNGTQMPSFTPVADVPELKITDQTVGTGKEATSGSTVTLDYIGALAATGIIFDNSIDAGQPATFKVPDEVIPGFGQGVIGMKVGGTRQILIPSDMGYGAAGAPPKIPANSDLVFTVSLRNVQ
jgi:FKBP-type peptidyl-prolyl cis-trans isomerase